MEKWVCKKIKDFAYTASGGTPNTSIKEFWEDGTIPWINSGELSQNDFITKPTTYISEAGLNSSAAKLMPVGTVVIALTGATTGMSAMLDIETSGNQSITGIYPSDYHDSKFLLYVLQRDREKFVSLNIGSAQPHINKGIVDDFKVVMPKNKSEQTRIAEILSTVDEAIAATAALIAKYSRIKTGLMQDLLTRGIDESGNIRSKATHRFVVKNGMEVPEEWEVGVIEDVLLTIEQGWSPDCESDQAPTNEWGVLKTTSVTWDGYNEKENKKLPEKLAPRFQYEIKAGDILITRAGPNSRVGVVAYVQYTRSKLILSDKLYRLVPNNRMNAEFMVLALTSFQTQKHLSNLKTGMAESQTNISQKIISSLQITIPKIEEQQNIIGRLHSTNAVLTDYNKTLKKLLVTKAGLMQDLLTGKVRVKANDLHLSLKQQKLESQNK